MSDIRVLHVDDDPEFASLTAEMLEREDDGFEVVTEPGATDALDRLATERDVIDCIVSDYDMPDLDGLEFLEIVREEYPQLPFILFTGMGSERVASEAIARDATDYLQKQGGTEQYELLANRVRNAVEQHRSRRHLERQRREYRRLFEQAPVMFAIFREEEGDPVIEDCNDRFATKLGYAPADLRGRSMLDFYTDESVTAAREDGFERALAGELGTEERTIRTRGGDTIEVLLRAVPRLELSGTATGTLSLYFDVTERKEREREREERRQFYETVVEESRDGIRIVQDGTVSFVDDRFAEMVGCDPAELVGEPAETSIAEEYRDKVLERHDARMRDEEPPGQYEAELVTRDGERRHVELSVATIQQDGEPASLSLFRDITDRKERERQLQRERDRLETLFENLPNPVLYGTTVEGEHVVRRVNSAFEEAFGYSQAEIEGEEATALIVPDERKGRADERLDRVVEEGSLSTEVVRETPEGLRDFRIDMAVRNPDADQPERYTIYTDVTERRQREWELRRYEAIVEAIDDAVYAVDKDGYIEYVNDSYVEMKGTDRSELLGNWIGQWADSDVVRRIDEQSREMERGDRDVGTLEYEFWADGSRIPVETRFTTMEFPDGERGRVGVIRDITDRKERERRLRWYEGIVEATRDTAAVFDADGRFKIVNSRLAAIYGADPADLRGKESRMLAEIREQSEGDPFRELVAGEREEFRTELELEYPSYGRRVTDIRLTRLAEDGEFQGVVAVGRDIADRRARERELERQNERLNQFASVVSHDLRAPLNTLSLSLELVETDPDPEHVERCHRAIDRMEQLIDDLLALARQGETIAEPEPVDLAAVAGDCWRTVETGDVELTVEADATVTADEGRLKQLLENLFRNALDHGETVTEIVLGRRPDGFYVADDGVGIPAEDREQVFQSGYSTASEGTGFGLSIVETIAGAHGWEVTATESESGGARFEVTGVDRR
jgi:PAS domain S-box-containing protein